MLRTRERGLSRSKDSFGSNPRVDMDSYGLCIARSQLEALMVERKDREDLTRAIDLYR